MQKHYFIDDDSLDHNYQSFDYNIDNTKITITTDSGVFSKGHIDFGSNLLINSIPTLSGDVLDLGCGYGIIGIALSKKFDINLTMCDVNSRAGELAKQNSDTNGVAAEILISDGFEKIDNNFDYIVSNPPIRVGNKILYRIFKNAHAHIKDNGSLFLVLRKKQGAESIMKELSKYFDKVEAITKKKGFVIVKADK